jgi:primosomal protein N'
MELPTVASIAVAAPLDRTLSYRIPVALRAVLQVGHRVKVPLGRRTAIGYVFGFPAAAPRQLKPILELLDDQPLFAPLHAHFYERAARYYAYPLGRLCAPHCPPGCRGAAVSRSSSGTGSIDPPAWPASPPDHASGKCWRASARGGGCR